MTDTTKAPTLFGRRTLDDLGGSIHGLSRNIDYAAQLLQHAADHLHDGERELALKDLRRVRDDYSGLLWGYLDELIEDTEKAVTRG